MKTPCPYLSKSIFLTHAFHIFLRYSYELQKTSAVSFSTTMRKRVRLRGTTGKNSWLIVLSYTGKCTLNMITKVCSSLYLQSVVSIQMQTYSTRNRPPAQASSISDNRNFSAPAATRTFSSLRSDRPRHLCAAELL